MLGGMLVSQHNVYFMNELMSSIRRAIAEGTLDEEEDKWLAPGLRSRDVVQERSREQGVANGADDEVLPDLNGRADISWSRDRKIAAESFQPERVLASLEI